MNCFLVILFTLSTLGYCKGTVTRTGRATYDFNSLKPRQTPYIKQNRYIIPVDNAYPYSVSYVEHPLPISKTIIVADAPQVKFPNAQALLTPDSQPQYLSIPKPLGVKSTIKYWPAQRVAQEAPQVAAYQVIPSYVPAMNPSVAQNDLTYLASNYIRPSYTLQPNVQEYPKQQNTPQYYQEPKISRNHIRSEHINSPPVESPKETLFTPLNTYRFDQTNPHPDYISIPKPLAYRDY